MYISKPVPQYLYFKITLLLNNKCEIFIVVTMSVFPFVLIHIRALLNNEYSLNLVCIKECIFLMVQEVNE